MMSWNLHVIAHISHWAGVDWAKPEDIHTQVLEVIEFGCNTIEITKAVAIRIKKGYGIDLHQDHQGRFEDDTGNIYLVDDGRFPPGSVKSRGHIEKHALADKWD